MSTGFFGKVHTHGDFVQRDLPRDFVTPWDAWLQESLAVSRERLGEQWLARYLVAPIWRFALTGGICGPQAWLGLLMPSVDRVGRYFPLTLATALGGRSAMAAFFEADAWFRQAAELLVWALEDDFDLEAFHRRVQALAPPPTRHAAALEETATLRLWGCDDPGAYRALLPGLVERAYEGATAWGAQWADQPECHLLLCRGLPPARTFIHFLDTPGDQAPWTPLH